MKKRLLFIFTLFFNLFITAQDGSLDFPFNSGTGANNVLRTIAIQPDGKIIIGGEFTTYNGTGRNCITRLNSDGSVDATFNSGTGSNVYVDAIAIQSDGKIIIGGAFNSYNGTVRNCIARLNSDGTLDSTFNPGTGTSSHVGSIILQSDGKMIISGLFASYNGTTRNNIARLNSDGSLDTSFDPGAGANGFVKSMAIQPNGKIIIGGEFSSYNGITRKLIARLNSDGSLDTTFNPGTGANASVNSVLLQLDGKIIIVGYFTNFNGTAINRIARLNGDGSLDAFFNPGTGANAIAISTASIQSDEKIIIGGSFTAYNGTTRNRIARLNSNGSLDAAFNPVIGANSFVWTTLIQPDGKIVIGGNFTSYDGISQNYIARINNSVLNVKDNVFEDNTIFVFKNNTTLHIEALSTTIKSVKIFDITGRMLLEKDNINASTIAIENLNSSKQILIVQVKDSNNLLVSKKIIY
jgi:uncharacterized delta-60 repeat protein